MSTRSLYRRHSPQFKLPLCADIRDGKIGRREAKRTYPISANRIQLWLSQYDRGELMLKKRPPRRSRNMEPKLQHWSARSVHSQWRSTCLKKRHGCDPKAATSPPSSSAVRCLRGPTGVSDDPTSP